MESIVRSFLFFSSLLLAVCDRLGQSEKEEEDVEIYDQQEQRKKYKKYGVGLYKLHNKFGNPKVV